MKGALVSATGGALQSVLEKLASLLGDEYKLFHNVRCDIEFLTHELSAMKAFLLKMSMKEDPDEQDKVWMNEVRELSYDIEDSLDDFMVNAQDNSAKPYGFMQKIKNLLDTIKPRRQLAKAFNELKNQVIEVGERSKRYKVSETICKVSNVPVDPRALAIFEDVSNLVGINGPKNELIRLFTEETRCESCQQQPKMISIVGSAGLGKTTLASQVYKEQKDQFDCHAFVSVSRNPDMMKILRTILSQLKVEGYSSIEGIQQALSRISDFLVEKRYFIVVDDIWNVEIWDVIKCAFPMNVYDCRIITTTRVHDVAQSCCSSFSGHKYIMDPLSIVHSRQLFHKRLFNSEECPSHLQEVSSQILEKCAGLPLAIIAISGLLANKGKTKDKWHQVESSIGRGLERNPSIEAMINIISLSYFDLPRHLKTCMLYLSIFPEDHVIEMEMLIRRWIAEGFIHQKDGYTLYEAGEMCFNELINRNLIQPNFTDSTFAEVATCRVHDTVLDFILSKSKEENFVTIIGEPGKNPDPQNMVRRLSLQNNGEIPVGLTFSAVRSLNIFGDHVKIPPLLEFKHLRVLCYEDCGSIEDCYLADIGNLLHLKFLSLNEVNITKIPEEIAKLKYLETLHISNLGDAASVPATISPDGRLVHFSASNCDISDVIEGIEALEVLAYTIFEVQSTNFIQQLGDLKNLRNLKLHLFSSKEERGMTCSIRKLVQANLRSLQLSLEEETINFVQELNLPAECSLQELYLDGIPISKVPRWMGSLLNLQKLSLGFSCLCQEDLEVLVGPPNLSNINIYYDGPSGYQLKAAMEVLIDAHPNHPLLEWWGC